MKQSGHDPASVAAQSLPRLPRLLVVDDEPINIQVLFQIFREDHDVVFATSGEAALESCRLQLPDLLLLDVQMPGLDGLEVCRQLKADAKTEAIPVIFVSGRDDATEIAQGLEAGAVDFITKPVNPLVVRARVRTHLTLKAQAERKRLTDRMQQAVEWAPNAMIMVDAAGVISLANAQAERLFGYSREELIGRTVDMLVPSSIRARHPTLRQQYAEAAISRPMGVGSDLFGVAKDGRQVPIEIGLSSFRTEESGHERTYVLASIVDITERKQAQEAQRQLNESLQAQVAETQRALQQLRLAQNQLVQSEKMASLGGLVAGVAHEINTPVGVGVTAASHLRDEILALRAAMADNSLSRSRFEQFVDGFEQAGDILMLNLDRAAELIRSFKRVAVDQSSDERRRIHLQAYIGEVLMSLRPRVKASRQSIDFDCQDDIEILTTPGAISQIITNLVMNSLTHAYAPEQSGVMRLQLRRSTVGVRIEYSDDGCGISAESLPRIFDPFFTARRGQGGTGLGLHIVFNLVSQTLGGRIEAHSQPGQGVRFVIELPCALQDPPVDADKGL